MTLFEIVAAKRIREHGVVSFRGRASLPHDFSGSDTSGPGS